MRAKKKYIGFGLLAIVAIAGLGVLVMLLWNAVVPGVFQSVRTIDYPRALGLLLLCRILFGGFRGRGGFRGGGRSRLWNSMTPEEQVQLREAAVSRGNGEP